MAKKTKIRLPVTVVTKEKTYEPGEPVSVSEEDAAELVARHGQLPEPATAEEPAAPPKPKGKALDAAIAAAINALDPEDDDHFTRSGKPSVPALERALGYEVSAAERDAVWATIAPNEPPAQGAASGSEQSGAASQ